jgi:CheY-like chemotaxis protein
MPPRGSMDACPACERPQTPLARFCGDCGTPLVGRCAACDTINVRTRTTCHRCGASLSTEAFGTTAPESRTPAAGADDHWPRLIDAIDAIEPTAPAAALPTDPDPPDSADDDAARRRRKAERRASMRRAQRGVDGPPPTRDALVLEADPPARAQLCQWLDLFGFRTALAVSVPEAEGLSLRRPQAAVFLGVGHGVDGEAAAALCRRLQRARQDRPRALIAVLDAGAHADRVRLQLAGADAVLLRPVGRGDVARALGACGLALPNDPRERAPEPAAPAA